MISEGRGEEILPRAACQIFGPPDVITAYRFDSLTRRLADDDMFSSDFSEDELKQKLGHVHVPALLVASADDEYVPRTVDASALCLRMAEAMAAGVAEAAECLVLEQGGHGVRGTQAEAYFVEGVVKFISKLNADADGPCLSPLTWEVRLAGALRDRAASLPAGQPLLVALTGMPGSGKSRTSQILLRLLQPDCFVLQMDGFHTKMADLKCRPDAESTINRRGAPDTFDVAPLREALQMIRSGPSKVKLPCFDHAARLHPLTCCCLSRCDHTVDCCF